MHVIDKFIETDGILGVCAGQKGALDFAFSPSTTQIDRDKWAKIFNCLVGTMELASNTDEVKVMIGTLSFVFQRRGETYVGVVVPKGHLVVKSLQRMVRGVFKKIGVQPSPVRLLPPSDPPADPPPPPYTGSGGPRF